MSLISGPFPSGDELRNESGLADVRVFEAIGSTQVAAGELADAGELSLPGAVVAQRQIHGRGRGANRWWSAEGTDALTVTFALKIDAGFPAQLLPLCVGVAVRDVLSPWTNGRVKLKWPNDLLIDDRKLAGILCERVREADLVGIGLNLAGGHDDAPPEVRQRAVSIAEVCAAPPGFGEVFGAVARAVVGARLREDWHEAFNEHHSLTGRAISIDTGSETVRGVCEGVDREGLLMVEVAGKIRRVMSGTVRLG